ncbi:MAG: hypothetical protein ACXU87_22175 [Xanthobacteraceae bacterium]
MMSAAKIMECLMPSVTTSTASTARLAPAKIPPEIIDKLAKHVIVAARDPATAAQLAALGIEPNGTTPEEFEAQINREQPQFDDESRPPSCSRNSIIAGFIRPE